MIPSHSTGPPAKVVVLLEVRLWDSGLVSKREPLAFMLLAIRPPLACLLAPRPPRGVVLLAPRPPPRAVVLLAPRPTRPG